jgi:hypothetical protein
MYAGFVWGSAEVVLSNPLADEEPIGDEADELIGVENETGKKRKAETGKGKGKKRKRTALFMNNAFDPIPGVWNCVFKLAPCIFF